MKEPLAHARGNLVDAINAGRDLRDAPAHLVHISGQSIHCRFHFTDLARAYDPGGYWELADEYTCS